jgi:hypothetical protein
MSPPSPPSRSTVLKTAESRQIRYALRSDGAVLGVVYTHQEQTRADAEENVRVLGELLAGRRAPLVMDLRQAERGVTSEAREVYSGPQTSRHVTALAFVADGALTRMLANMMLVLSRLGKTALPMKMFEREEDALAWALGYRP